MALNLFRAFQGLMSSRNRLSARPAGENPGARKRGLIITIAVTIAFLLRDGIGAGRLVGRPGRQARGAGGRKPRPGDPLVSFVRRRPVLGWWAINHTIRV